MPSLLNRLLRRSAHSRSSWIRVGRQGFLRFAFLAVVGVPGAIAQTRTAEAIVHGRSVQLSPSNVLRVPGVGDVTSYFTTFNGTTGSFLIDAARGGVVSGELRPRANATGVFEGAYAQSTPLLVVDYGSYAVSVPTSDGDGNGIPDLFQYDRAGDFQATGSGFSVSSGVTFSISLRFVRPAGAADGSYTATTQNSAGEQNAVSGRYSLLSYAGSLAYNRGATNTMAISMTGLSSTPGGVTLTGSTTFTTPNVDQLSHAAFTARGNDGSSYQVRAGSLSRFGSTYRGAMSLADGLPQTSWADYTQYVLVVRDLNDTDNNGVPDLTDSTVLPPAITGHPLSRNVTAGQSFTLSVVVSGATSFQWYKDGVPVAGALQSSYAVAAVQLGDAGNYHVVATNVAGSVVSTAAVVTVSPVPIAPTFAAQPLSLTAQRGSTVVLSAQAVGSPTPTYQWSRGGVALVGSTASTLVLSSISPSQVGTYACSATNPAGSVTSVPAVVNLSDAAAGRMINLSIRTQAGSGAELLIVGFSTGGAGTTGTMPLLLRAVGPSLAQFGVPGVLQDPRLTVYSGNTAISTNDNWSGDPALVTSSRGVGAFALAANDSKDAVLLSPTTAIGGYTVQVTGSEGGAGVALAEIYDAASPPNGASLSPRLVNVSARARAGTDSDMLITGFVIGGSVAKTVLIRAVGPTLTSFGVPGVLEDPRLSLYAGSQLLKSNDDWGTEPSIAAVTTSVGGFPLPNASRDSAIYLTLPPGGYTAQVSGPDSGTGVALVEVYEVPLVPAASTLGAQLVAHYPLNGSTVDASGNGVAATATTAVSYSTDRKGRALAAATIEKVGFIDISNRRLLQNATQAAISVWVENRVGAGEGGFVVAAGDSRSGLDPLDISIRQAGRLTAEFTDCSVATSSPARSIGVTDGTTIPTGRWIHLVAQFKSEGGVTVFELYLDGVLTRTFTYPRSHRIFYDRDMPVQIGSLNSASNESFRGKIDDVRFYSRTLTSDEIRALYELTTD